MREEPDRLVFLDETAITTKMFRLRGRTKRGQRFKATAPFGHWGTQTFIAALRCDGLTAPWIIKSAMNRALFEAYVETQLAPTSIPLRWPSPSSKLISAASAPAASKSCGKPSAPSATSTLPMNAGTTSSTLGMPQIKRSEL